MEDLKNIELAVTKATESIKEMKDNADKKVGEVKTEVENVKADIKVIKDAADKNQTALDELIAAKNAKPVNEERKSFNSLLSEGIKENFDKITNLKKGQSVSFEMKAVADMDFATNFSTADTSVTQIRPGIIELPKRKLHLRSLLQSGTMGASNFDYVKEVTGEGTPGAVAEGAAKSQLHLSLQEVSSPSQYIAGYLRISRKMLDDVQGMTTFLQSRLLELLLRKEDDQILNGNGTSPNLSGITDAGNFTAASTAETADALQLIDAIRQLEGYDREANGILLSPTDYWNIAKVTNQNQTAALVSSENGVLRIGGVPVYRSTAVAVDQYVVGDWVMGSNFLTREAPRVEFAYEDAANFTTNKVTVRVEERVALPIYGSDYFIVGDFGNVV